MNESGVLRSQLGAPLGPPLGGDDVGPLFAVVAGGEGRLLKRLDRWRTGSSGGGSRDGPGGGRDGGDPPRDGHEGHGGSPPGSAEGVEQAARAAWRINRAALPGFRGPLEAGSLPDGTPTWLAPMPSGTAFELPVDAAMMRRWLPGLAAMLGALHRERLYGWLPEPACWYLDGGGALCWSMPSLLPPAGLLEIQAGGAPSSPYLAPELRDGALADPRGDLYALGAFVYSLLTGELPPGEGDRLTAAARLEGLGDPGLARLLARLLAADPAERGGSVAGLWGELLGEGEPPSLPTAPPCGRNARPWELEELARLALTSRDERRHQALWLHGEPGAGKSWLLGALRRRCEAEGLPCLLLAELEPPSFLLAGLRALAREGDPGAVEALAPFLAPLLPLPREGPSPEGHEGPPALPAPHQRIRFLRAAADLAARAAEARGLVLLLDGWDGRDAFCRELAEALRRLPEEVPLFLLAAGRGGPDGPWEALGLEPLPPEEAEALAWAASHGRPEPAALGAALAGARGLPGPLLRALRGAEAPPPLLAALEALGPAFTPPSWARLFERAHQGGPEAAWAMLEAGLAGGGVVEADGRHRLADPGAGARALERLDEGARCRLHAAAARALAKTSDPALAALAARHGLLAGDLAALGEARACAERLLRAGWHEEALALLVAGRHLLEKAPADEAARQWILAARVHEAAHDPTAALEACRRAAGLLREHPGEIELLRGRALVAQGRLREGGAALAAAGDAHRRAGDEGGHAEAMLREAGCALAQGELVEAYSLAERALEHAGGPGRAAVAAEAVALLGEVAARRGDPWLATSLAWCQDALQRAEALGWEGLQLRALELLCACHAELGSLEEALAAADRARGLAAAIGDRPREAAALVATASLLAEIGSLDAALDRLSLFESAHAELPSEASACLEARALSVKALVSLFAGYLQDPLRLLDHALRLASESGSPALEREVLARQIEAMLFLGKYPRAEELAERARAVASSGHRLPLLLAEVALRVGDAEEAAGRLAQARAVAESRGADLLRAPVLRGLARLALEEGRPQEALAASREALPLAARGGSFALQADLRLLEGEAQRSLGDRPAALEAYEQALNAADAMNCPHFRSLALHGIALCTGDPQQANYLLDQAVECLNIYLEQMTAQGKKDFLNWAERRRILAGLPHDEHHAAPSVSDASPKPPSPPASAADSILGFLHLRATSSYANFAMLDEIFRLVTSKLSLDDLTEQLNSLFIQISGATRAMVYLINEDGELVLLSHQSTRDMLTVLDGEIAPGSVLARVRASGQTLCVLDVAADPELALAEDLAQLGVAGVLCMPLKITTDDKERVIGLLYGDRGTAWLNFGAKELSLLDLMTKYTSVSLENAILQVETHRKTHRLEMLYNLSRAISGTLDIDRLLHLALSSILGITRGQQGYFFFGRELGYRAGLDSHGHRLEEPQVSASVIKRVRAERKAVAILDIGLDQELQTKQSLMIRNIRSVMCVPLIQDDHLLGLLYISSSTANKTFSRHDLEIMEAITAQITLVIQNAQSFETIQSLNRDLEARVAERTGELQKAYEELQEAQVQLVQTERLATIGTLAGGVAHEINNPLGAILSNAQLLKPNFLEDADTLESLVIIEEGARRCKEIVDQLLKYSRPARHSFVTVDLKEMLAGTFALLEPMLRVDHVYLYREVPHQLPPILGDTTELGQVFTNLVMNARDAVRERHGASGAGEITIRATRDLDWLRVQIIDNGQGMSEAVLRRIFDPFFTTKAVGMGRGLGLSVSQKIVEKHGGQIGVASVPDEGTTITINFPVP